MLTPAQAARYLLAFQSFAIGGMVPLQKGDDAALHKFARGAPLTGAAVILVRGRNLFETLMLNLHAYSAANEEPFAITGADRPAWESDEETGVGERSPLGYLDLLTWQCRRLLLQPQVGQDGQVSIREVVVRKGLQLPPDYYLQGKEPMLAFVKRAQAKAGEDPWAVVGFAEERALWRDSLPLLQSLAGQQVRPKMLDWLAYLVEEEILSRSQILPLEAFGLLPDQARLLLWRHERLPLPLAYLANQRLVELLGHALTFAEEVGRALRQSVFELAKLLVAPAANSPNAREPTGEVIRPVVETLAPDRRYWPRLEGPFTALLLDMAQPAGAATDEHALGALAAWQRTVHRTALEALGELSRALGTSGRTLKAVAAGERVLHVRLARVVEEHGIRDEEEALEPTDRS